MTEQNEKQYTMLLESAMDGFWEVDFSGKILRANQAACRMTGYSINELIGKSISDFEVIENKAEIGQRIERLRKSNYDRFETRHRIKSGEIMDVEVSVQIVPQLEGKMFCMIRDISAQKRDRVILETTGLPIPDRKGNLTGYRGADTDVTLRETSREALRASEMKFSVAFHSAPVLMGISEIDTGKLVEVNDKFCERLGYFREELIGKTTIDLGIILPEVRNELLHIFREQGRVFEHKTAIFSKSGEQLACLYNGELVMVDGKPYVLSLFLDITTREKVEKALKINEERFRQISSTISDICFSCMKPAGKEYYLNWIVGASEQITGYSNDELIGMKCWGKLVIGEDFPVFKKQVLQLLPGATSTCQMRLKHKNGSIVWIETSVIAVDKEESNDPMTIYGGIIDITARKKIEQAMADTNRKFARAQQIAHIGSWENHLATSTLTWSEEMHRILGFPTDVPFKLEEVTGVFPPAELEKFNKCISEAISTRSPYSQDYRIIRPDGETRYIHDEGEVTFNENGQPEIFFGTTQDITERKLNELELISTKELAEESNRLKSAFLNNMSHEIRTPINAIMGFSDLLSNAEEEERKRYSEIIRRSSQQLLSVIDDVIQVSRLQSEKIPVNPVVFSPVELITSVAQMFNLPELLNGLHLKINIPAKHHHLTIISDKDKIQQVLSNLISNAIKYTKNGSVDIGFVFQGNSIEFFVEDTGIGIPENERARVFEKFFRGEGVISAAIGGTGLGLNIAKELVELLGGTIGVSSEYNKGSRFYFSVPVEQFRETTVEKRSLSSGSTNLSNLIILIVEDNFENYLLLEIILRNLVKRIDHAWNGKEALDLAAENRYDLVLMDLKMPVMGGFEATIELRKLYPDIPVIAQTAYAQPEEREGAFKAGCDDYISKPVKKELLLEIMGKCSRK